jgi:hypothetical protein
MKMILRLMLILLSAATLSGTLHAQGWQVSPARQEVTIAAGQSLTFAIRVEREASGTSLPVRFTATPRDWDLNRTGETIEAAAGTKPFSANSWMTFTPAVFEVQPASHAWVRVTVSVPPGTTGGVYRAALFFEEHSVVPDAAAGMRRMVLRYRLSTLIYVVVPAVSKKVEVKDVAVQGTLTEGLRLTAVLDNTGTMHLRPQHWVEITGVDGAVLFKSEPQPTMALLPGHQLEVALAIPAEKLAPTASFNVRYFVDADKELAVHATAVNVVSKPVSKP